VRLWQTDGDASPRVLEGHASSVESVSFSPDEQTLASAGDRTVRLWRVADGASLHVLEHTGPTRSVAFSPDGQTLASGLRDGSVWLWRVTDGAPWCILEGHTKSAECVAFSPNGKILVSGSRDETVYLWKITGEGVRLLHVLEAHGVVNSVAFSRDGHLLALGLDNGNIWLYQIRAISRKKGRKGEFNMAFFSTCKDSL
jgi:WD40 repeat protein